jgi:hypothetical protein
MAALLLAAEAVCPQLMPEMGTLGLTERFNGLRLTNVTPAVRHTLIASYGQLHPPMNDPASAISTLLPVETGDAQAELRAILRQLGHQREGVDLRTLDRSGLIRELVGRYLLLDGTAAVTTFVTWPVAFRALLSDLTDEHFDNWFDRFSTLSDGSTDLPRTRFEQQEAIVFNTGVDVEKFHQVVGGRLALPAEGGRTTGADNGAAGGRRTNTLAVGLGNSPVQALDASELAELSALFPPPGPPLAAGAQSSGQWHRHLERWLAVARALYAREFRSVGLGTRRQESWVEGEGANRRTHDPIWAVGGNDYIETDGGPAPDGVFASTASAQLQYVAEYRSFRNRDYTWGISLHAGEVRRRTLELIADKPGLQGRHREVASCLLYVDFHHEYMHYMVDDFLIEVESHRGIQVAAAVLPDRTQEIHDLEEALCEGYAYAACRPRGRGLVGVARKWLSQFRNEMRREWPNMGAGYEDGHLAVGQQDRDFAKFRLLKAYLEAARLPAEDALVRNLTNQAMKGRSTATLDKYTVPTYLAYSDPADAEWLRRTVGCVRSAAVGHWWREART